MLALIATFDWNHAADVASAANRKARSEKYTRQVMNNFGCHSCLHIVTTGTLCDD